MAAKRVTKTKNIRQINYWTIGGFEGDKSVAQALAEAKDMGYEGVELVFGTNVLNPKTSDAFLAAYRSEAKKLGMSIATLCSGAAWDCSMGSDKEAERKKAVAFNKAYLEAAGKLGAKAALVIPGTVDVAWNPARPHVSAATVWKQATKSIRSLIPVAEKYKVAIALENVWNKFLTGPFEMKAFIDQFKSRWVGCYFDVANCTLMGYAEDWIEVLGSRIKAVHFKNFTRTDCAGGLHGFGDDLLDGDVNFPAVMKALKKIKYTGAITAEMIPFKRLPDLVLPDMDLARDTAPKLMKVTR